MLKEVSKKYEYIGAESSSNRIWLDEKEEMLISDIFKYFNSNCDTDQDTKIIYVEMARSNQIYFTYRYFINDIH